ncbi:I78 family peptidase inhibitor [Erythrobacter sp. HA6-11]
MDEMDTDRKFLCAAESVQSYVGQNADRETGIAILKASGARILRWGAPDSAWTMDYREDRVNVRYDRAMTITDITCR